jgi:hypothetical protein
MTAYFADTEFSIAPMMCQEITYWLSCGYKLFLHRKIWRLQVISHKGNRVIIRALTEEVDDLPQKPMYEKQGIVIKMKQEYLNAHTK